MKSGAYFEEWSRRPGQVRADMVYFTTGNDGAVFSIGSITYAGALAFNEFDNNISRITSNVLNAFRTNLPPE
jgi:N,N-dimethylformamidase